MKNKKQEKYDFYKLLPRCEVCGIHHSIVLANSQLAEHAISYCEVCISHNAEPEWLLNYKFEQLDFISNDLILENLSTYVDGKYISWNQWINKINEEI